MSDDYDVETLEEERLPDRASTVINEPSRTSHDWLYKDFRAVNIYTFLDDAYTGRRGFSGRTERGDSGNEEVYSYIQKNPTENFYPARIKGVVNINHFRKFINAPIKAVFSHGVTTSVQTAGGSVMEKHQYIEFIENITGGGVNKNEFMKRQVLTSALKDSVVFVVMDKKSNGSGNHISKARIRHNA